jgi:hypothetical protein
MNTLMKLLVVAATGLAGLGLPVTVGAGDGDMLVSGRLEPINVETKTVEYRGKTALGVTEAAGVEASAETLVIIPGVDFGDGTIEVDLAGAPAAGASGGARGFVGIAFRVQEDRSRYECFYLRPTNGRAEDQLRRNHSAQYIAHPEFPWHRLREETPGKYESYVDLAPGEWTQVKIVVSGRGARLFVHGADQPTLIVNDLKLDAAEGAIGLWIGPGTEAHFANFAVSR